MATTESDLKTYSIPVPGELDQAVRARMKAGGFNSLSEYVRAALRADVERATKQQLEEKLLRALDRGEFEEVTSEMFDGLRARAKAKKQSGTRRT